MLANLSTPLTCTPNSSARAFNLSKFALKPEEEEEKELAEGEEALPQYNILGIFANAFSWRVCCPKSFLVTYLLNIAINDQKVFHCLTH